MITALHLNVIHLQIVQILIRLMEMGMDLVMFVITAGQPLLGLIVMAGLVILKQLVRKLVVRGCIYMVIVQHTR